MLYLTGHAEESGFLDVMENLEDFVCENGMISFTVQKNHPGRWVVNRQYKGKDRSREMRLYYNGLHRYHGGMGLDDRSEGCGKWSDLV